MSNIDTRTFIRLFYLSTLGIGLLACSPKTEPLTLGKPALAQFAMEARSIDEISLSTRLPGIAAWRARAGRGPNRGEWKILERSDQAHDAASAPSAEIADGALIEHLLDILGTFTTEEEAGNGSDAGFGLAPYRVEIRWREHGKERGLLFGDSTGSNGIFFRRLGEKRTWIGRGALVPFFANLRSSDFLVWHLPYLGPYAELREVALEKLLEPGKKKWEFKRQTPEAPWTGAVTNGEASALLERILRQRWSAIRRTDSTASSQQLPGAPDWRIRLRAENTPEQTLEIVFDPAGIYARNSLRPGEVMELYPEFAGALRAFTQLRFTPVKSGMK